jgi:hypothetical protein
LTEKNAQIVIAQRYLDKVGAARTWLASAFLQVGS